MEAQKKFKLRRRVKTLRWAAWSCLAFFAAYLTTMFIVRAHSDGDWSKPIIMIPILIGMVTPLFAGLVLTMFSQFNLQELINYRRQILTYRARKYANKAIGFLQQGDIKAAVEEYIKLKKYPEKELDDTLYGMLIATAMLLGDEKLKKIGSMKTNEIKEEFNPSKIVL